MPIRGRFKTYFSRGLAVLLPTIVTIWIFVWAYRFIRDNISIYINQAIVHTLVRFQNLSEQAAEEELVELSKFWVHGWGQITGFVIALIFVFIVGVLFASVVGRALWRMVENFIMNTPVLRRVYPYVKQITDFFLTQEEQKKMFTRVVAVEYPRKDIWSIGFVTGSGIKKVVDKVQKEFVTILIPNSPAPVTGYVIMVPKELTIPLDMTIEEAFRFAISGGVIAPSDYKSGYLPTGQSQGQESRKQQVLENN